MKKVLLTGFNPFGGDEINPSLEAVKKLQGSSILNYFVETCEIPTIFDKSIAHLIRSINQVEPEIVICVGQAGGRPDVSVERIAINVNDARIADNEGNQPIDTQIASDGPPAYWSTLPIKAIVKELNEQGIPASVSNSAGTFVCNHLFYGLMHHIAVTGKSIRGGFIHIPFLPEQTVLHKAKPSMALETIVKGLELAIHTAIRYEQDIAAVGGEVC